MQLSRFLKWAPALALVLAVQTVAAGTMNRKLTAQRFEADITVNAAPGEVWSTLTDVAKLTEVMGYELIGGASTFGETGRTAKVKVWGEGGNFTMIRSEPSKEARFSLDPEGGSYICSCRWTLTPRGKGTVVHFVERYTESSPQSAEAITDQVADTDKMLGRLKAKVEKKSD